MSRRSPQEALGLLACREEPWAPLRALTALSVPSPQIQCHSYTGYCWCVTPNGRPISGTAVAHKTPRCPGRSHSAHVANPWLALLAVCRLSHECLLVTAKEVSLGGIMGNIGIHLRHWTKPKIL